MNTKHWVGVCILTVVAGLAVKLVASYRQRPGPDAVQVAVSKPSDDVPWLPLPNRETPKAAPVSRSIVREYVHEPIVTRPEPLEAHEESVPPLPTTGGLEERAVSDLAAPRPDRDARHMPYADEDDACERIAVVVWLSAPLPSLVPHSAFVMSVSLPRRPAPELSEESEEPPISDEAPPARVQPARLQPTPFQPPLCPHGGHCPYPYSYRYPQSR